jgi:hypothetical protein
MKRLLLTPILAGAVLACASPPPDIPIQVEYAGCAAVLLPGPVCRLGADRSLQLWIGAPPDARIEIRAGGRRIDARGETVQDGQRFSLSVPSGAKSADVRVAAESGRASWSLSFAEVAPVRYDALKETSKTLVRVDDSIRKLQLTEAREALQRLRLPAGSPAENQFNLSYYRGLLAEKEGDYRTSFAEMQQAMKTAERVRLDSQWMAELKLALLLRAVGRSQDSARLFERLRRMRHPLRPCQEGLLLNNHAWSLLLAHEAGESSANPVRLLDAALTKFESCQDEDARSNQANILINLALAHLQEGQSKPVKDLLARAHALEPHPSLPLELWRLDLEARIDLKEGRPAKALRRFQDLEALAAAASSFDGRLRATFGQARSQQALGDRAAALETLRSAEALLDEQSLQIPLHEGRETFLATRQALVSLHVELLLDEGRTAEALDVARQARSRILRQLERSGRLASLAPEQRKTWERLQADYQARRSRLEERAKNDWRLPADRQAREREARLAEGERLKGLLDQAFQVLETPGKSRKEPPPRPGELILAYHPLRYAQWVGFAADGKTVQARRIDLPPSLILRDDSEELGRRLLEPFRDSIRQARRIRILSSGRLQAVDFHALPFDGDVLLAGRPVVYGLDVPATAAPLRLPEGRALLVTDPSGNLPGAREEARMVRSVLESAARPWTVQELDSAHASARAVQGGLARAGLLHYAGHGTFSGFGGWDSSLLLADDTQLTLGDLLALDRVPAWVVLAACDAGQSSTATPVESLGLAHAFLLAGSRSVVASTRPADDGKVPAFFADLYRQLESEPDLSRALQRAQLAWKRREPRADWAGFRLFEP